MILNVSGRTDIVAFYSEWFLNRIKEGFVDVVNPFNPKLISRIDFKDVDLLFFCTKNPQPILDKLDEIPIQKYFHVTLTPYKKEIEKNVPDKKEIIASIKELSKKVGKDRVVVRYDPVFISDTYPLEYHKKAFEKLCTLLENDISKILISFLDEYQNVRKNYSILKYKRMTEKDYQELGTSFAQSAKKHHLTVHTCFEEKTLEEYGFTKGECLSKELASKLTKKEYKKEWKARKGGKCHCVSMVDIGTYNTCPHLCAYCYANYDEKSVSKNRLLHDKNSSLLIGHIQEDQVIKARKSD